MCTNGGTCTKAASLLSSLIAVLKERNVCFIMSPLDISFLILFVVVTMTVSYYLVMVVSIHIIQTNQDHRYMMALCM